jgi:putative oxidoreductase
MALHDDVRIQRWWPGPLRLFLGIAFLYHGLPKLFTVSGHQMIAGFLQSLGMPAPALLAWIVGLVEVLGAVALLAGVAVTFAAAVMVIEMLVALFTVHLPHGFAFVQVIGQGASGPIYGLPGGEVNLLYIAALLALLIGGPGPLSVEAWRRERRHPEVRRPLPAAQPQHA